MRLCISSMITYYPNRRDRPSFPTRRSSDLCSPAASKFELGSSSTTREGSPKSARANAMRCFWPPESGAPPRSRSEEHTSELQSHLNLVCRLLLEKKKKKKRKSNQDAILTNQ